MSCALLQPVAIKCVQIGIREQPLLNACHNYTCSCIRVVSSLYIHSRRFAEVCTVSYMLIHCVHVYTCTCMYT